jgi:hypothetical protein
MPSRSNRKKGSSRSRQRKSHKKTYRKTQNKKHSSRTRKNTHPQRGGFNSCSLATVQEPGFSIPAIGDVPGFSLSDSKGAIHRPNCKTDTYQAMTP